MNFELSAEQQMLKDSVERFVADHYSLEQRQGYTRLKGGFSKERWQDMADLGWIGLAFSETDGGFGGTAIDVMLLMEAFGQGLMVEPYLATAILGGGLIAREGNDAVKTEILPSVIEGRTHLALAFSEIESRFDLDHVATRATASDDQLVINGQKSMVIHGGTADHLLVSVRTDGAQTDQHGITLVRVDAGTDGVKITGFPTVDGLQAAEITFTDVSVPQSNILGKMNEGYAALETAVMYGILAVSAEAVGAMEMLYKDTTAYIQEREQFDHPLAEFQVLRHRMVDMFMEYEQAKSLLYRATLEVDQQGAAAMRTVHALKHFVGKTGISIGEAAVQSHGGMGVTEELRIGHFFKRLLVIDALFGNSDHHLALFAA